jgi:hypothetical protein
MLQSLIVGVTARQQALAEFVRFRNTSAAWVTRELRPSSNLTDTCVAYDRLEEVCRNWSIPTKQRSQRRCLK